MQGVYTALITSFQKDGLDRSTQETLIERQVAAGVSGIVIAGSTGEGQTLRMDEWKQLIQWAQPYREKLDIMVSCGSSATWETVEKAKMAEDLGAKSLLVASPAYNKPTAQGLIDHFGAVGEAVTIPIMVYNIPGRTAVNISADTMKQIWPLKNILALKESAGDWAQFLKLRQELPSGRYLFSGDDPLNLAFAIHGAHGSVSVVSNVFPQAVVKLWKAIAKSEWSAALETFNSLQELTEAMFWESNPIPVKWAVAQLIGKDLPPRSPLTELQTKFHSAVREKLEQTQRALGL